MHSQEGESQTKSHVLTKHLSIYDNKSHDGNDFILSCGSHIFENMGNVKEVLTNVESAILLSDLYDRRFGLYKESPDYRAFGPMLYNDQEDPLAGTRYESRISEYIIYNINKIYGMSLNEFLDQSPIVIDTLIQKAKEHMENIARRMEILNKETAQGDGSKNTHGFGGLDFSGMEDLIDG